MNFGTISLQTKISALIKANPAVIEALVSLNPHFSKLRNPVLRKLLASRVTVADACKIAGSKPEDFMDTMASIGFEISNAEKVSGPENVVEGNQSNQLYHHLKVVELDVRPILSNKEDPLNLILNAVKNLKEDESLKLINTFEPLPLINLLEKKGFKHYVERPEPDLVITWFSKGRNGEEQSGADVENIISDDAGEFDSLCQFFGDKLDTIDVRHLQMPLPMVTILQHLETLPAGRALFVLHKKVPVFLLSELKERGFKYLLKDAEDKKVNMLIYKT